MHKMTYKSKEFIRADIIFALGSTLIIFTYLIVVSNVYPQDVLRQQYINSCAQRGYAPSSAMLFQSVERLEDFLRSVKITKKELPKIFFPF